MVMGEFRSLPKSGALGQAPAIPTNIRLGWEGSPETYTIAFYEYS
jgi:hypothetical protein